MLPGLLYLPGLHAIAADYDDFVVDLWGVIHDGARPFLGVLEALRALAEAGKRVLFVTNSSRTRELVIAMLEREVGVPRELFFDVVSSGDVTREALVSRDARVFAALPPRPRCYHFGDREFVPWLFELDHLAFVDDVRAADIVVATGTVADEAALAAAREHLEPAAARRVPLVCTNPDEVIPSGTRMTLGPGAVARAYAELGAPAFLYGKPHAPIYAAARQRLGTSEARRLVAVGDLLDTDIAGAAAAGLPSILVVETGVHGRRLGGAPEGDALDRLFAEHGVRPAMVLKRFAW